MQSESLFVIAGWREKPNRFEDITDKPRDKLIEPTEPTKSATAEQSSDAQIAESVAKEKKTSKK